jgi:murein L,D-transpeptidase YafK
MYVLDVSADNKRIIIRKSQRTLYVYDEGKVIRKYNIALGAKPIGHKKEEGDGRTPEGVYSVIWKNRNSKFNKSLMISYPNKTDVERASSKGVSPGGNIAIHGIGNSRSFLGLFQSSHWYNNWTKGCIAVTDKQINEIYKIIKVGTIVDIRP